MNTIKSAVLGVSLLAASVGMANAQAISGNWKTQGGETAAIAKCGGSYCITLKTGEHKGKRIGKLDGSGNQYDGTITDPANNKEYTGSAKINGGVMKLKGCALKVLCRTQTWNRL